MRLIALKLFPKEINSLANPAVQEFKQILENIAKTYECSLRYFAIDHGMLLFQFDNEELIYDISKDLDDTIGVHPTVLCGETVDCDL